MPTLNTNLRVLAPDDMRVLELLKRWSTFPVVEVSTYRCTNCSAVVEEAATACPECGGDVTEFVHSTMEMYWPHH